MISLEDINLGTMGREIHVDCGNGDLFKIVPPAKDILENNRHLIYKGKPVVNTTIAIIICEDSEKLKNFFVENLDAIKKTRLS
ncbi:MAG: hypothetical protein ABH967_02255 [Patescibacteria group bacterium]